MLQRTNGTSKMKRKVYEKEYSRARDGMLKTTDSRHAPWHVVRSDDKRRARLNCISHILASISCKKVANVKVKLPKRSTKGKYDDQATLQGRNFVEERYSKQ